MKPSCKLATPPVVLELVALKQALRVKYEKEEDPDKVWHEVQGLVQKEGELVEEYIKKFSALWESLCRAFCPISSSPRYDEEG